MKSNVKLCNVEFLRIVFTLSILFHHIFNSLKIWNNGAVSVEFFFIISGFFLAYTFDSKTTFKKFVIKKLVRFYPLIVFGVIVSLCINPFQAYESVLTPLLLLVCSGISSATIPPYGSWYICVLFWVSLFLFSIIRTTKKTTLPVLIGGMVFLGYITCIRYDWKIGEFLGGTGTLGYLLTGGMVRGFSGMGLGYLMARSYTTYHVRTDKAGLWHWTLIEVLMLGYLLSGMFFKNISPNNRIFLVIDFIGLFWLFLIKKGLLSRFFSTHDLSDLSDYCLAIFLTHQLVIEIFLPYCQLLTSDRFILTFIVGYSSIVFGVIVQDTINRPISKYLMSKLLSNKAIK